MRADPQPRWIAAAALGAALLGLGVALACAWRLLEPAPGARVSDRELAAPGDGDGALAHRVRELEARLDELEMASAAVIDPAGLPPEATREELAQLGDPEAGTAGEEAVGGGEPGGDEGARESSRDVLRRLARLEDPQERLLLARELLRSEVPLEQLAGVLGLAELAPAEAFLVVDQWLAEVRAGSRSDRLVIEAARALEEHGEPRCMQTYVASLAPGLASPEVGTRRRAVFKLGTTRSPSVTPLLAAHLRDASPEVRIAALDALRTSGDARAISDVEPMLDDPTAAVRDRAVRTLETLRRREAEAAEPRRSRDGLRDLLRRRR